MRKDLWAICLDIYRELFWTAEPSADFDKLVASGETNRPDFFLDYFLEQGRQDSIMKCHIDKHRLNHIQAEAVRAEVCLGCSPRCVERVEP